MISVEEALALVERQVQPLPAQPEALGAGLLGQTLAEAAVADCDSPPFAKSLVDGLALRVADPLPLRIGPTLVAGQPAETTLAAGMAVRIMTGAPLPAGADAVVPREHAVVDASGQLLDVNPLPRIGQFILPQGREYPRGATVVAAGTVLTPGHLAVLAAVGVARPRVIRRPRVAVLATGNELVEPRYPPGPGQIRNSNSTLLLSLACQPGCSVSDLGIARDHTADLRDRLAEGLRADVLLITGGVSAGELDLVPAVLRQLEVTPVFHQVRMKPGKPLWFGTRGRTLVFGLPGNPVSGLAGFVLFVRPALARLQEQPFATQPQPARLITNFRHQSDRPTFHPAVATATPSGLQARLLPWFGSPDLLGAAPANALAALPAGEVDYSRGETIPIVVYGPVELAPMEV